ncbi:MAG: hypothetical protein JXR37_06820 [Kiritimatiellae bacterium]|nr:hypothetical protein [Kiritimatiellia bacterium]
MKTLIPMLIGFYVGLFGFVVGFILTLLFPDCPSVLMPSAVVMAASLIGLALVDKSSRGAPPKAE